MCTEQNLREKIKEKVKQQDEEVRKKVWFEIDLTSVKRKKHRA